MVSDLQDPILLEMPGGRNGSASSELFTDDGELRDNFDGKVDTCQYWNFALGKWDGSGCIVHSTDAISGKLMCHCYHLTDFGGVASDAIPKMSMPDPLCVYVCVYVCIYAYMYVYMYECKYVIMYICMYLYVYVRMQTHSLKHTHL